MTIANYLQYWLNRSLARRMITLSVLAVAFSAVAVGWVGYLIVRSLEIDHNDNVLMRELASVEQSLTGSVSNVLQDLEILANTPPVQGLARTVISGGVDPADGSSTSADWLQRLAMTFESFHQMRPAYLQIRFIGLADNGRELVRVDRDSDGQIVTLGADLLQEKAQEPYFQASLQMHSGELYRSGVSWNREFGQIQEPRQAVIRFATPVFAEDGSRFGLIAINILAVPFTTTALNNTHTQRDVILSDGLNTSFHYSAETGVGEIYLDRPAPAFDAFQDVLQTPQNISGVSNRSGLHIAWDRFAYLDPLGASDLIAVTTPSDNFTREARGASTILLSGICILTILAMIVSYYGTKREIAPLLQMNMEIAKSQGSGRRPNLPVQRTDEIGQLAQSFDGLIGRLILREKRAKAVFEGVSDGVLICDAKGQIEDVNPALAGMMKCHPQNIIGTTIQQMFSEADCADNTEANAHCEKTGDYLVPGMTLEREARRTSGETFPMEVTFNEIALLEGRFFAGVMRDVSEHRRQEAERQTLIEALRSSNDELNTFAYSASHDLKAPLRAIHRVSQWIEADIGDHQNDEIKENFSMLYGRVDRMVQLLDDLLEHAKIGKKTGQADVAVVNGVQLRDSIVALVNLPETAKLEFDPVFEDLVIQTMPLQVVLLNLISNALKHSKKPDITIRVSVVLQPNWYEFSVQDDGPGIEPRYQDRIFGMFQTLKSRDEVEGSGMGLAICRKNVVVQGGTMSVKSDGNDTGATFIFTWPRHADLDQRSDAA